MHGQVQLTARVNVYHACVAWVEHEQPWKPEVELIRRLVLPLNLRDNDHSPFFADLKEIRAHHRQKARSLAIA